MKYATKEKIRKVGLIAHRICSVMAVMFSAAAAYSCYISKSGTHTYYILPLWICIAVIYFTDETP